MPGRRPLRPEPPLGYQPGALTQPQPAARPPRRAPLHPPRAHPAPPAGKRRSWPGTPKRTRPASPGKDAGRPGTRRAPAVWGAASWAGGPGGRQTDGSARHSPTESRRRCGGTPWPPRCRPFSHAAGAPGSGEGGQVAAARASASQRRGPPSGRVELCSGSIKLLRLSMWGSRAPLLLRV